MSDSVSTVGVYCSGRNRDWYGKENPPLYRAKIRLRKRIKNAWAQNPETTIKKSNENVIEALVHDIHEPIILDYCSRRYHR